VKWKKETQKHDEKMACGRHATLLGRRTITHTTTPTPTQSFPVLYISFKFL
jgi:hypothetical protein